MGYLTAFEFSVYEHGNAINCDIISTIVQMNKNDYRVLYPLLYDEELVEQYLNDQTQQNMVIEPYTLTKWYDNDDDMLELSRKFPDTIFKLHGNGEEAGDVWDSYYKNGKMVTYNNKMSHPLNPKDLK